MQEAVLAGHLKPHKRRHGTDANCCRGHWSNRRLSLHHWNPDRQQQLGRRPRLASATQPRTNTIDIEGSNKNYMTTLATDKYADSYTYYTLICLYSVKAHSAPESQPPLPTNARTVLAHDGLETRHRQRLQCCPRHLSPGRLREDHAA